VLRQISTIIRNNRGQSIVEFALVLPLLLLLLLGIIDFGQVFYKVILANEAAREAARTVATSDAGGSSAKSTAIAAAQAIDSSFTANVNSTSLVTGDTLIVTVTGSVAIADPIMSTFLGNPYSVSAKANMRMEQDM